MPQPTLLEAADAVRSMRVRGAAAIACLAANALAEHVGRQKGDVGELRREARRAAGLLDATRPTAVSLHHGLMAVLVPTLAAGDAAAARAAADQAAAAFVEAVQQSQRAIAHHGTRMLRDGGLVLTHCHSTSVVETLLAAHRSGAPIQVIATETRPWRQGLTTVRQLSQGGLPCTLVVDSAVEHVLSTRPVRWVLVGADTVARDGGLYNKVGTAGVARLAAAHGVPFHSAAGFYKFSRLDAVPVEERERVEVAPPDELPAGVQVLNPVFDRTPSHCVTSYLTEEGLLPPAAAVARAVKLLPAEVELA